MQQLTFILFAQKVFSYLPAERCFEHLNELSHCFTLAVLTFPTEQVTLASYRKHFMNFDNLVELVASENVLGINKTKRCSQPLDYKV